MTEHHLLTYRPDHVFRTTIFFRYSLTGLPPARFTWTIPGAQRHVVSLDLEVYLLAKLAFSGVPQLCERLYQDRLVDG